MNVRWRVRRRAVGVAAALLLAACGSSSAGAGTIVTAPGVSGNTVPGTTINVPLSTVAVPTTTVAGSTTTTIAAVQGLGIAHTGLGGALFGADPDAVVRYMSAILGSPTSDTGWVATSSLAPLVCRGTQARFVAFHDLQLFFSDESGYAKGRLHFAAFTYGPAQGDHIDPYGLATDTGMKVGSTVAEMKKAYPKLGLNQPNQAHPYPGFSIRHGLTGILTGLLDTDTVTGFVGGSACTK